MKNIFEGAKFGDRFRTRDGLMAIFVGQSSSRRVSYIYKSAVNEGFGERSVWASGFYCNGVEDDWDIVGPWMEENNFPFDFPSDEEIENKAKEIVETKSKHLEDLYGLPLDDISATAMAGEMQDGLVDMVRWIKDRR